MAATLHLQISQSAPVVNDRVYDIVQKDSSTSRALPIPGILLQHAKELWSKLASVLVSSRRLDHMYRVQQARVESLFSHPK